MLQQTAGPANTDDSQQRTTGELKGLCVPLPADVSSAMGLFFGGAQPLQAASCHCSSEDHAGPFKSFTPLTVNCVQLTSVSHFLGLDLPLFTCFVFDFPFALIENSFGLRAAYLLLSTQKIFFGC